MEGLFREDGHLADGGLRALCQGNLGELERLEAAEHLGYCDACLDRYMTMLEGGAVSEPPEDLTLPVMRRLRQKAARLFMNRYATVAAAAVLAFGLWSGGVSQWISREPQPPKPQPSARPVWQISDAFDTMFEAFGQAAGGLIDAFQPKAPAMGSPKADDAGTDLPADQGAQATGAPFKTGE